MNIAALTPILSSVAEAALPHFFPKANKASIKTAVDNLTPTLTAAAVAISALIAALKTPTAATPVVPAPTAA